MDIVNTSAEGASLPLIIEPRKELPTNSVETAYLHFGLNKHASIGTLGILMTVNLTLNLKSVSYIGCPKMNTCVSI